MVVQDVQPSIYPACREQERTQDAQGRCAPDVEAMSLPKKTRAEAFAKFDGRCAYCGEKLTMRAMQVDHIQPKAHRGTDDIGNLYPSCRSCNNYKNEWSLEEFRREIGLQVQRARKRSLNFRLAERFGLIQETGEAVVFYFEALE